MKELLESLAAWEGRERFGTKKENEKSEDLPFKEDMTRYATTYEISRPSDR